MIRPRINPGVPLALGAYIIWGLLPLYIRLMQPLPAAEILSHRILWSLLLLLGLILGLRRGRALVALVRRPRIMLALTASATLIAINWLIYILAITSGHVAQASLGYFINPLVNVVLGIVVLRERLGRTELAAVAIAGAGVVWLAVVHGEFPTIPLTLAISFSLYGLVRKMTPVDAIDGLLVETLLLSPIALGWLTWFAAPPSAATPGLAILIGSGIVTALPLLLFAAAAKRIRYSDLGLLQYIGPTLQLLLAIFVFGEHLAAAELVGFAAIWTALAIYAVGASRRSRAESVSAPE